MKISSLGSVKSAGSVKKKRGVSGVGNFAELLGLAGSTETAAADATSPVASASPVNNLLAAQEVSEDAGRRAALVKDGQSTLDALEKLRHQLLMGGVPMQTLGEIKSRIHSQKKHTADPELRAIMDEIELRASVELAKLETALANRQAAQSAYPDEGII